MALANSSTESEPLPDPSKSSKIYWISSYEIKSPSILPKNSENSSISSSPLPSASAIAIQSIATCWMFSTVSFWMEIYSLMNSRICFFFSLETFLASFSYGSKSASSSSTTLLLINLFLKFSNFLIACLVEDS